MLSDLRRKWFVEMSTCAAILEAANNPTPGGLKISNIYPVFILLAVGTAVAIIWALMELVYYKFAFSKVRQLKRTITESGLSRLMSGRE